MKITAIICEYNPFHNGHAYHIAMAKKETQPDALICIMSGNFTQRGDIAILDKYTRARHAILGGADAVIELPTYYAVNCAEKFAFGACKALSVFDDVTLSFGSECGDLSTLEKAVSSIKEESHTTKSTIKEHLANGDSYVSAFTKSLDKDTAEALSCPNNTLAIEYMKASKAFGFKYHTIKRLGSYNDITPQNAELASATAIRTLLKNKKIIDAFIPDFVGLDLEKNLTFNDNLFDMLAYAIISAPTEELSALPDVSEGLENRIIKFLSVSKDYEGLIQNIKTKRYTMAKIKRVLLYALFGLSKQQAQNFYSLPPYIKALAVKCGREDVLAYIAKQCSNTISKFGEIKALPNEIQRALYFENKVDDIYHKISKNPSAKLTNCQFIKL